MESSQVTGHAEECSSSESGWTMYLASSTEDDHATDEVSVDLGDVDDGERGKGHSIGSNGCEGDSDDSMASDACTGPAPCENSYRKCKDADIIDHHKYHVVQCDAEAESCQYGPYLMNKPDKEAKIKGEERRSFSERKGGASSCFKSCFKVRKSTNWNEK